VSVDGVVTKHLVDSNRDYAQVIEERDAADTLQVAYTYGDDLISQDRGSGTTFYHYDGLGSTRVLSDGSEATIDSYTYEAFGNLNKSTGTTLNRYLFAGEQFDPTLDQYYLRARYYDQASGRFTQQDTWIGNNHDPITLHKYLYANADPGNVIDPSGQFGLSSFGAASSIRGTLSAIARTTIRVIVRVGQRGWNAVKRRPWVIYRVKLSPHALSHEFIWTYNRKTRKGLGYHVQAPLREAARTAFTPEFIQGTFAIIPQRRANVIAGRRVNVISKERVAFLGNVGFAMWSAMTVGTMSAGDSCSFRYNIPRSSCVTWTNKAARNARIWQIFPL
jgi:RHS repeat-associated protein